MSELTTDGSARVRLRVDPLACDGVGMCAHLVPSLIRLDRWGFPIAPTEPLSADEAKAAKVAVAACPKSALILVPVPSA